MIQENKPNVLKTADTIIKGKWEGWWDTEKAYGDVLFKRATGEFQEMESSKAAAKHIKKIITPGESILDVGCGAGHYLVSLKKTISSNFKYVGVDVTKSYIDLAKNAFLNEKDVDFQVADIFKLPFPDKSFDIVMCNNVFLHLPSIKEPLQELCRIAKKTVLIRTMVGKRSFRIMDVHEKEGDYFWEDGEPNAFHFFNIYSEKYIAHLLSGVDINNFEIIADHDFKCENIEAAVSEQQNEPDVTRILGGFQVNGYIIQPWAFIKINIKI